MSNLFTIFLSSVGPIVAIAGVGYVLARVKEVDPEPLNTVIILVLAPALILHSLAVTELSPGTLFELAAGVFLFTTTMWAITELYGRWADVKEPMLSALVLAAIFSNSGNLGIPVSDFAFGEVGRQSAVLFLSVQSVLVYTLGVYIASRSGGTAGLVRLKRVFSIPLIYAVLLALILRTFDVVPPAQGMAMQTLKLIGNAAIPVMLLVLGIQLAHSDTRIAISKTYAGIILKLAVAPLIGLGVVFALGFTNPVVARVFVLETAMPAAVTPVILVVEFATETPGQRVTGSEFISACVLVTTLLSIPLLTLLILILQSGILV